MNQNQFSIQSYNNLDSHSGYLSLNIKDGHSAMTNDGKKFLSGGYDDTIRCWDLIKAERIFVVKGASRKLQEEDSMTSGAILSLSIGKKDKTFLSASQDLHVNLWNFADRTLLMSIDTNYHARIVQFITKSVIIVGDCEHIYIWDLDKDSLLSCSVDADRIKLRTATYLYKSKRIVGVSDNGSIHCWKYS